MQRSDFIALRERVTAKGGFPQLLATIELMLLHREPGYKHELHPAVRHYRVQSQIARTLLTVAATAEPEQKATPSAIISTPTSSPVRHGATLSATIPSWPPE